MDKEYLKRRINPIAAIHAIREDLTRGRAVSVYPCISTIEALESLLVYAYRVYGRKPSSAFNRELRAIQIARNSEARKTLNKGRG